MGTDMDVNSVRSDNGAEAEVPENLGVDDAGSDENTELNRVESQGVDKLNNDIAKKKWMTWNVQKRRRTMNRLKMEMRALRKHVMK